MTTFLIAVLSVLFSVGAQFLLKTGMSGEHVRQAMEQGFGAGTLVTVLTDKYVMSGFLMYGLGAIVWLGVLAAWDVSRAYPIVGLGFALTVAIGWMIGENVTLVRAVGVAMICTGVVLVARN